LEQASQSAGQPASQPASERLAPRVRLAKPKTKEFSASVGFSWPTRPAEFAPDSASKTAPLTLGKIEGGAAGRSAGWLAGSRANSRPASSGRRRRRLLRGQSRKCANISSCRGRLGSARPI